MKTSKLAQDLKGSEIIKIAGEVNKMKSSGEVIYNQTIGDFDASIFPIPEQLKNEIVDAYQSNLTNYPAANGMLELRKSVSSFLNNRLGLDYSENEIQIAAGARPLIYAIYQAIVDIDDTILFPAPSWNNDAYTFLSRSKSKVIETQASNRFMPSADDIKPYIKEANLLALCSPLNPTGTTFSQESLKEICDLVLTENEERIAQNKKPLYVLYDQIYWQLTFGNTQHYNPVSLAPAMRDYVIFVDGISKAFAATGVRVGWAFGPQIIIDKIKAILGHIGAWSPKPEQIATANFLQNNIAVDSYLKNIKEEVLYRLNAFYKGFTDLKKKGFLVDAIQPEAAIYLTVQFNLIGKKTKSGKVLENAFDITSFLLKEAKLAIVPFYAFGASNTSNWFRLSVGTAKKEDITTILSNVEQALETLQ